MSYGTYLLIKAMMNRYPHSQGPDWEFGPTEKTSVIMIVVVALLVAAIYYNHQ